MEQKRESLGMTQDELFTYFEELLVQEAQEAAVNNKTTVEEELAEPGFASVRASASYFVQLISANNAFIARYLLDHGILVPNGDAETKSDSTG
jgi:hypothetical protein